MPGGTFGKSEVSISKHLNRATARATARAAGESDLGPVPQPISKEYQSESAEGERQLSWSKALTKPASGAGMAQGLEQAGARDIASIPRTVEGSLASFAAEALRTQEIEGDIHSQLEQGAVAQGIVLACG